MRYTTGSHAFRDVCRVKEAGKGLTLRDVCRGPEYDELVAETVAALRERYGPALLIHWEDFSSRNSYRLLQRFRDQVHPSCGNHRHCFQHVHCLD